MVALLSLAMALSFTMASAFAVGKPTVTVETAADAVKVGSTVVLRVSIKDNPGFTNFEWNIRYDKARLELTAIDSELDIVGNPNHLKTGFGYATCARVNSYAKDTDLFTLTFTVKADAAAGNAEVTIASDNFKDNGTAIDANYVAGGVTVNGTTGGSTPGGGSTGSTTPGGGSTGSTTPGGGSTGSTTPGGGSTGGTTPGGGSTGGTTPGGGSTGGTTPGGGSTGGTTPGGGSTGDKPSGGSTVVYNIIEGANGTWTQNSDGTLTVRADGVFSKFKDVKVDGNLLIAGKDYTAKSGSTLVTLSKDYLATLSVGDHALSVVFNDGEARTNFTVNAVTPDNPQTGDHSGIVLAVAVLLVSGGALTVLGIAKKKAGKC